MVAARANPAPDHAVGHGHDEARYIRSMRRTASCHVTPQDTAKLLGGADGVDLHRIIEGGVEVAMKIVDVTLGSLAAKRVVLRGKRGDEPYETVLVIDSN